MIKTLSKAQKMEREKFRIPRSVQDAIPIRRIFADGIFQVGNQYSKTWSFTDINYAIASKEDKTSMFLDYSELLNALDSGASAKITIYNRRINKAEFERSVLLPDKDDGLDEYRHEFNQMLMAQVTGTSNSIVRERYLTVSVVKRNADEARSYFARVGTDLVTHLAQLSSVATELTLNERMHIFRDFFKAGEQAAAEFNIHEHAKRGLHFKDWFCPDSMEFAADHFKIDARYGRVLYLQDYASYIKDSFVSELCDLDRDLMLSMHNKLIVNYTQIFAPALHDLYAAQKILDDKESQRQELNQQVHLLAKKLHNLSRLREKNCITAAQYWERRNPLERELTDVKNTISKAATNHPLLRTLAQTKQLAEHYTYLKPLTEFDEYEFKFAVNRVLVDSESCTFELKNGMKFKEIF